MARLAMHAAVIGGLSLFGLLVLLSVNSSLKSNIGLSWRGGRRARYLAVNLYYRARNVSMLMTARAMGTAMRHGTPNGTSLRATQGMDSDGSTGAEVEMDFKPMHVNQSGRGATAFGKHNASVVFEGHEGQRFNLARNWKSECAEGKDLPRLHDQPWPMYRLTDSSLGIRPRFPWGSGKGLDEEGFKNGFRFYLYDEGPFNMSGAEDCFRAKWKLPPRGSKEPFEGLDSKMSHENRMYLLELFLWQSIRDHPMRTRDPSEAGLFIIGYTPIMLDWSSPCAEVGDKTTREKEIHAELVKSPHFKRKSGADHLFLWTRYNLKPDKALRGLLDSGPIVAVLERSFFMLQRKWPKAFERGSVVMMPYVSSGFIDTREDTGRKDVGYRARRYFFRGNMNRHGEGQERQTFLPWLAKMLSDADFMHRKVNVGKDKLTVYTNLLNETSSELRRSAMCPCPEGDSPTTLRPFESLAAGCVPVFFVEKEVIAYDIPFPSLIDWDSVAFFARSMQEITKCGNGLQETFNFLDALGGPKASPEVARHVKAMREAGKEVFRRHFSFLGNPQGVVSSMLYEARELLTRGLGHNVYQQHLRYREDTDVDEEFEHEREKQQKSLAGHHTTPSP